VFDRGSGPAPVGDQTYQVRHSSGALDIFFDPASASAPTRLHAVFN
ncbi:MAG: hypothetical protein JWP15_1630, partial [Alphaproteobacteria bacterium]|nr:hypothetical protein [Alphaproteobacteria bacterium]